MFFFGSMSPFLTKETKTRPGGPQVSHGCFFYFCSAAWLIGFFYKVHRWEKVLWDWSLRSEGRWCSSNLPFSRLTFGVLGIFLCHVLCVWQRYFQLLPKIIKRFLQFNYYHKIIIVKISESMETPFPFFKALTRGTKNTAISDFSHGSGYELKTLGGAILVETLARVDCCLLLWGGNSVFLYKNLPNITMVLVLCYLFVGLFLLAPSIISTKCPKGATMRWTG